MVVKNIYNDEEYTNIIKDYLNDKVLLLENIPHHDTNRLDHCLKVSYKSYKLCRKLNLNYESAAKAGLLHDFYFNRIEECTNFVDKFKLFSNEHPYDAVKNAKKYFELSELEENIIVSHMWPASKYMPKYKESFVVGLSDKLVSISEVKRRYAYRLSFALGTYFIFMLGIMFKNINFF